MHSIPLLLFHLPEQAGTLLIDLSLAVYAISLIVMTAVAAQGIILIVLRLTSAGAAPPITADGGSGKRVTIQLPLYNEMYVAERLIRSVCAIEHPADKLQVQVLDDSSDGTVGIVSALVREYSEKGVDIEHIRRQKRTGYKAGALEEGLRTATGEFIVLFDADFVPKPDFLQKTLPYFADEHVAVVQTRWEHINEAYSLLTRAQAFAFDGHFMMDQQVRSTAGHCLTFNGTGGVWRKDAILDAGSWQADTLTEDLDLSYRAQLRGWKILFRSDITSPSELPTDFNALKAQQYRWTKGYIQTARKILPALWGSAMPLRKKLMATLHLGGNIAFPFVLIVACLNAPVALLRSTGVHDLFFMILWVFVLGFISTFLFYLQAQRVMHKDWIRRMLCYYPAFLAGSMGLAVSNTKAVLDALFRRRSSFLRTPKYDVRHAGDTWAEKQYTSPVIGTFVLTEILLALYCFFGAVFSLYQLDFWTVPFQLLFTAGFSLVAGMSIMHALAVRRSTRPRT